MNVIEQFVRGKQESEQLSEDMIVVSPYFSAIIDGATDKHGRMFNGVSSGRFAAQSIASSIKNADPDTDFRTFIDLISEALKSDIAQENPGFDVQTGTGPSAALIVFSRRRREIWRVGDASWIIGSKSHMGSKKIDTVNACMRAAFLRAHIRRGATVETLMADDIGRDLIHPLLEMQHVFRNIESREEPLGFGAIDGNPVPDRYLELWQIQHTCNLVFASDGYPIIYQSLAETEAYLHADVASDPLRIGRHPGTKGVRPGADSFDDRAYLRLAI